MENTELIGYFFFLRSLFLLLNSSAKIHNNNNSINKKTDCNIEAAKLCEIQFESKYFEYVFMRFFFFIVCYEFLKNCFNDHANTWKEFDLNFWMEKLSLSPYLICCWMRSADEEPISKSFESVGIEMSLGNVTNLMQFKLKMCVFILVFENITREELSIDVKINGLDAQFYIRTAVKMIAEIGAMKTKNVGQRNYLVHNCIK